MAVDGSHRPPALRVAWLVLTGVLVTAVLVAVVALLLADDDETTTSPPTTTAVPSTTVPTTAPDTTGPTTTSLPEVTLVEPEFTGDGYATYRYGPYQANLLDLHAPPGDTDGDAPRPALLYFHSGGWTSGSRVNMADFILAQLDRGWMIAAVDYRLAPEHVYPAPNQDVDRVIRWLRLNAAALGLDPDGLVLIGTSAGGQLALAGAADPGRYNAPELPAELDAVEPLPAGVVSVSGPSDLTHMYNQAEGWGHPTVAAYLGCGDACDTALLWEASPLSMVRPTPAPGLFIFGELDTLVPADVNGYPLQALWEEAGGDATVWEAVGYGHNLALGAGIDPDAFAAWLDAAAGR